jgi:hypothetical protein
MANTAAKNAAKTQNGNGQGYPTTREALHNDLVNRGYTAKPASPNGYIVYKHPNGSTVTIKPSGEVIPTIRVSVDPQNTAWNAPKYNMRVNYDGTPIPNQAHSTGHYVEPYSVLPENVQ